MTLADQTFSATQLAHAAGIAPRSVADWATRGLIAGHVEGGGGRGNHREFSFQNLMEVAVAVRFMESGIKSPKIAFQFAQHFSHTGDETREPGFPLHQKYGNTWMLVAGEYSTFVAGGEGDMIGLESALPHAVRGLACVSLNVSRLFSEVCSRLDLGHPYKILDDTYPTEISQ